MLGRTDSRSRAILLLIAFVVVAGSLGVRLAYWQVVRRDELAERRQRDHQPDGIELALDDAAPTALADRFAFLDPRGSRLQFALGD